KRRTRRTFKANVQKVSYVNAEGKVVTDYVCARCLKTVKRA
ncbi:MAG: bL28 family ribosomal protein, partial [Candidatus Coproplasma sp.]